MTRRARDARVGGARVTVLGTVPGIVSEAKVVENALQRVSPDAVALGVSPEDLEGLLGFLDGAADRGDGDGDGEGEGEAELDDGSALDATSGDAYVRHLSRFGDVALPPPDIVAAVEGARARGVPVEALDLPEEAYTDTYTSEVSTWQLWRLSRRGKKLDKRPPEAASAWAFSQAWDAELRRIKGFDAVERAREAHMAKRLRELAGEHGRVLAVVEASKADGVLELLERDAA